MFLASENVPFPEILRIAPKVGSAAVRRLAPETTVDLCCGAALEMMRLSPNIVEHNRFILGCGEVSTAIFSCGRPLRRWCYVPKCSIPVYRDYLGSTERSRRGSSRTRASIVSLVRQPSAERQWRSDARFCRIVRRPRNRAEAAIMNARSRSAQRVRKSRHKVDRGTERDNAENDEKRT
jgi:hypothetical protein